MAKEQIAFNFEEEKGAPKPAIDGPDGRHLEANDECQNCGNAFESDSPGCVACRNNAKKLKYLEKLAEEKKPTH